MTNFDDAFGPDETGKQLRARQFAALQELAIRTGDAAAQSAILQDVARAGLVRYVRAARSELAADLADTDAEDVLATLRAMVEPTIDDSRPDPNDPDIERYRRSGGLPL